jgi:hypothetical protein
LDKTLLQNDWNKQLQIDEVSNDANNLHKQLGLFRRCLTWLYREASGEDWYPVRALEFPLVVYSYVFQQPA